MLWNTRIRIRILCLLIFLALLCFIPDVKYKLHKLAPTKLDGFSLGRPESEAHSEGKHHPNNFGDLSIPTPGHPVEELQEVSRCTSATLCAWLQSRGITSDATPLITIGDSKYLRALHSLRRRLDLWGRGQDLVVLCLDAACAQDKNFHAWYACDMENGEMVMDSVASLKLRSNLELAQHGYNFVFLDGDVFLTGSRDPFLQMLPLSDDTWDMQFQRNYPAPSSDLNIGWYFVRASPASIEFFESTFARWNTSRVWDQQVMNDIAWEMESASNSTLRIHLLDLGSFQNFMIVPWEDTLFGNETRAAAFVEESTLIHMTCIEQELKTYMGSNFGGFADVDGYYSNPPPLIRITNVSGTSDAIHSQVAFALQVATVTNRTLIWPDSVSLLQQYEDEATGKALYYHRPRFPGALAVNYEKAEMAGFSVVEGRYLQNQQQYRQKYLDEVTIKVNWLHELHVIQFERLITALSLDVIPVLDFENFGAEWRKSDEGDVEVFGDHVEQAKASFGRMYQESGMENYTEEARQIVPKCVLADGGRDCRHNC